MPERFRLRLEIEGIVQGVGFRPWLHRLARRHGLSGWCRNTVFGVELEVEGSAEALSRFRSALGEETPPLARISTVRETWNLPPAGATGFHILPSRRQGRPDTLISPDIATCPACVRELRDPQDRRYRYPFINCTNCGPRFTIVKGLPYDRFRTSMGAFPMCPECRREYDDIQTRRYHAQPDCCPACGPTLRLLTPRGEETDDPIAQAKEIITSGGIVAVKGLGGYHLACRADLPETVAELRRRKHRDERPFALMCRDLSVVRRYCILCADEEARLGSPRAPIVLLRKGPGAPQGLSPTKELGIMLPYTPIHHLLMEGFDMLVMTSMNLSDRPVLCEVDGFAWQSLADACLTHDREIVNRCDDSLLRVLDGREVFFRRSRGYAPEPVALTVSADGILACGAEQKASFSLARGKNAFLAQHIGDLKDWETFSFYQEQIDLFERRFGVAVSRLVCDLHPDYLSSQYARRRSREEALPLVQVQHHHAHMAACMADNGLEGECIGLIWDGTGYGSDGTIWGAECLSGGYAGFRRIGSIRPVRLPGGDRCATEIGRVAHSLLWDAGQTEKSGCAQADQLTRMLDAGLNCPPSSGMGRLFDGVYALITGRETVTYEGQGAILLEAMAEDGEYPPYDLTFYRQDARLILDTRPLTAAILADREQGTPPGVVAARFLESLVRLAVAHARYAREQTGLSRVVLSGGVFQNRTLLTRVPRALTRAGFEPYTHSKVSPNDQGIALGQTLIAAKGGGIPCV